MSLFPPNALGELIFKEFTTGLGTGNTQLLVESDSSRVYLGFSGGAANLKISTRANMTAVQNGFWCQANDNLELSWATHGPLVNSQWYSSWGIAERITVFQVFYRPKNPPPAEG